MRTTTLRLRIPLLLLLLPLALLACDMNNKYSEPDSPTAMDSDPRLRLPRNMALPVFDPHRPTFECQHQADAVPPIDPEAEALFQEGMYVTRRDLWPDERDYKRAAELWTQAAARKHWKAQVNLAALYIEGNGVEPDEDKAIQLVEELITWGVPAGYDIMGIYHMNGVAGLEPDATVAYAFMQRAAELGSPTAQAYLGDKLDADYDSPSDGFWGNRAIGLKMLECAFAQGDGKAARQLGITYSVRGQKEQALRYFQEGVKFGNQHCAEALEIAFNKGPFDSSAAPFIDKERANRYRILGEALWHNPNLRFPNLDAVLPLPKDGRFDHVPDFTGTPKDLVNAAKAVTPPPPLPQAPRVQLKGDEREPERYQPRAGHALPSTIGRSNVRQRRGESAPHAGYWRPYMSSPRDPILLHVYDSHKPLGPMAYFAKGERLATWDDRKRVYAWDHEDQIWYHYVGAPVPLPPLPRHARVRSGVVREVTALADAPRCRGTVSCPHTGIWQGSVAPDHPTARIFNEWWRQAFVREGQPMPDPKGQHLNVAAGEVTWRLMETAASS